MTDIVRETRGFDRPSNGGGALSAPGGRTRRRLVRTVVIAGVGAVGVAIVCGFVQFADRVAGSKPPADARAEGIVVLTGGSARIDGALKLLTEGRGERLLISGVNPSVTRKTLASTVNGEMQRMLACCVDLDRQAEDTVGNASETRQWAKRRGFKSLIVVTSDYHMPRSIAELAEIMPNIRLIPYPVTNPDLRMAEWWRSPKALGLLAREYGKFLLAETRQLVAPSVRRANAAGR